VRVALCDDHAVVRRGLRRILDAQEDFEVVGEAGTVKEAIALAAETHPDVFVMDLGLPDGSGISAAGEVGRVSPATRVLVLTVHDDAAYLRRVFDAGAIGYLVKEAADIDLVGAIREVAAGRSYVHPSVAAAVPAGDAPSARLGGLGRELSEREVEVIRLLALGLTNAEIADRIHVSVGDLEAQRADICRKLEVRTRAELVRLALAAGLLGDDTAP
jgi:two-component system response regulator NreC